MRRFGCIGAMALYLIGFMATVLLILTLCGCSSTVYVPVETVRDRWHSSYTTDTVRVRDSVVFDRAGDTIRELRWRDRWRTSIIRDTVSSTDTIRVPLPVERELSRWEQAKMDFGGAAIGGIAVVACIAVVWLIRKFRK